MYFREILYWVFSLISDNRIQIWLKSQEISTLLEDVRTSVSLLYITETSCVLCEVGAESEETVELKNDN
jgi:hypothetical protein